MSTIKRFVSKIPLLRSSFIMARNLFVPGVKFNNSAQYWEDRYRVGGNSGAGSYGRLALFKARVLNDFVEKHDIDSVVEFGCGDGAQLELVHYREYTGFDVSRAAVDICQEKFSNNPRYEFFHTSINSEKEGSFDLALSIDVIFHLVEDRVFEDYMTRLFRASRRYVIVYAFNYEREINPKHVLGREFTKWCKLNATQWQQVAHIKNDFPSNTDITDSTSPCDFFIFEKTR